MKKHRNAAEVVGDLVAKTTDKHPVATRRILEAAYRTVAYKEPFKTYETVQSATDKFNARVAKHLIRGLSHPQDSVLVSIYLPCEILHALGLNPQFPEVLSCYLANTYCSRVFCEAAEADGLPESLCSYHKTTLGLQVKGVFPAPGAVCYASLICDANQTTFRRFAERAHVPRYMIDVPRTPSEDAVRYVKEQLRGMAGFLEQTFDIKLDLSKLDECCKLAQETLEEMRRYVSYVGSARLDTSLTSELCMLLATHCLLGTKSAYEYIHAMAELAKKSAYEARHGNEGSAITDNKPRIFWIHTSPNWQYSMQDIFNDAQLARIVGTDMAFDVLDLELDVSDSYEFMARRMVYGSINGRAERRLEVAKKAAEETHADGVIIFGQGGCKQTLGLSGLAQDYFDIPMLFLEGDGADPRGALDAQMKVRVQAFLEQLRV